MRTKWAFKIKQKKFFIIFQGLSLKQIKRNFFGRWESDFKVFYQARNSSIICWIKEEWWIVQQFAAIIKKTKIRIRPFSLYLPKDAAVVKVWIVKLNREKDNFPSKVYIWSDHFEDECFDSSWMLQFTLNYSDRPIQRPLCPGTIPTKYPHKPVKERHFSKQREETHRKKEVCFSY